MAVVLALVLSATFPASAIELDLNRPRDPVVRNSLPDLQILENRQRRQEFQQRQQFNREIDRQYAITPPQRLEVPRVRQNCQVQAFGNSYLRGSCR